MINVAHDLLVKLKCLCLDHAIYDWLQLNGERVPSELRHLFAVSARHDFCLCRILTNRY